MYVIQWPSGDSLALRSSAGVATNTCDGPPAIGMTSMSQLVRWFITE